jgi:thiazole synthase ThiGH ThiG subunit
VEVDQALSMSDVSAERDAFQLGAHRLTSRLIVGSGKYATFELEIPESVAFVRSLS